MNSTSRTWLASAIQDVLHSSPKPRPLGYEEVRTLASRAQAVNEAALEHISGKAIAPSEQVYVAMQLLRASNDHGRGMLHLLHANPQDMANPALALHRSQIENFLRGAYLGFMASPEIVQDFLENDVGVREPKEGGGTQFVGPNRLAKRVDMLISELSPPEDGDPSLAVMVDNAWSPLCGMVHGGKAVRAIYQDKQGQIGCDIPAPLLIPFIANSMALSNYSLFLVLTKVFGETEIDPTSPFTRAFLAFNTVYQGYKQRNK